MERLRSWSFAGFAEKLQGSLLEPEVFGACTPICATGKDNIILEGHKVHKTVNSKPIDAEACGGSSRAAVVCRDVPEYEVHLDRDEDTPLGMRIASEPDGLKIVKLLSQGAILVWNSEHPRDAVKPGDTIVEVNGMSAVDDMMEGLKPGPSLRLRIRRLHLCSLGSGVQPVQDGEGLRWSSTNKHGLWQSGSSTCNPDNPASSHCPNDEFTFTLENPRGLPIGLQITSHDDGLMVLRVREVGLITSWNSDNPQLNVNTGDILLQVNETDDKLNMLHELNHATKLKVKLRRGNLFKLSMTLGGAAKQKHEQRQFSMERLPSIDCGQCQNHNVEELEIIQPLDYASKPKRSSWDEENPSESDGLLQGESGKTSGGSPH